MALDTSTANNYFYANNAGLTGLNLLPNSNVGSFMCWTRTPASLASLKAIFSRQIGTGSNEVFYIGNEFTGAFFSGGITTGGSETWPLTNSAISTSTIYHFAVTWDGGSTPRARSYVNGVQVTTTTGNNGSNFDASDRAFILSGNYDGANAPTAQNPQQQWDSNLIEDVRIYNRALSAAEIQTIYFARGTDNIVENLIGRWFGLGVVGTNAGNQSDESQYQQTLTAVNTPQCVAGILELGPPQSSGG